MPPETTQPKYAPTFYEEVARDPKLGRPVPLRPKECCTTIPESKEKGGPIESRNPAPVYITMQSKGYDKSEGRATHSGDRADITTEGSDVDDTTTDGSDVDDDDDDDAEATGYGSTAESDSTRTEATGTAEVMLEKLRMRQVLLEERLSVLEARLEKRLLVIEALLGRDLQERWRLRRDSSGGV